MQLTLDALEGIRRLIGKHLSEHHGACVNIFITS